jgi:hypothetical protein
MVQGGIPPGSPQGLLACRTGKKIEAEVVLGVQSRSCQGHGICRIYTKGTIGIEKNYCHYTKMEVQRSGLQALSLRFKKEGMRNSTYRKFFRTELFFVEEPVALPVFLCRGLSTGRSWIPAGKYRIHDLGKSIEVIVPISSINKKL